MYRFALATWALLTVGALAESQPTTADQARAAARRWHVANEAAVLAEFREVLSIPNVASDIPNIRRNAELLVQMLRRRSITARLLELDSATPPAVFGELRVPGATRTIVLYAHYDGQPVDPTQWTGGNPFAPVLRDRALSEGGRAIPWPGPGERAPDEARIYARSTSDDKGSIVAMLSALDALRTSGIAPSVNLKFFFEGEEEAGSPHLREILQRYADDLRADAWLFCDGPVHQTGRQQIVFGTRGIVDLEVTVYGPTRPLHSGHYGNWAPNPAALLVHLLASMRNEDGRITIAGFYDDVRPPSEAERRAIAALPPVDSALRESLGLARTEADNAPLAERIMLPALNIRGMSVGSVGDRATNTIHTAAHASIDFRLVPNQTPGRVRELVEAHLRERGYHIVRDEPTPVERATHPRIARLRWGEGYPPNRSFMETPFATALVRSVTSDTAAPFLVPRLGGSGPDYIFTEVLGAPVAVLPIANHDNNQHAADENIRVQNLRNGIELYAALFARIGIEWRAAAIP